MSNGPIEWLKGILDHYGEADNFEDASSVRFMLAGSKKWLEDQAAARAGIADEKTLAYWDSLFADEVEGYTHVVETLEAWLKKKGLEP